MLLTSMVADISKVFGIMKKKEKEHRKIVRIPESKGAMNLKTFSGDKKEFQEWKTKVINQFAVTYKESRAMFKQLVKVANERKKIMEASEIEEAADQAGMS